MYIKFKFENTVVQWQSKVWYYQEFSLVDSVLFLDLSDLIISNHDLGVCLGFPYSGKFTVQLHRKRTCERGNKRVPGENLL